MQISFAGKTYSGLSSEMVKFLNDTELINALEFDAFAELQKRFGNMRPVSTASKGAKGPNHENVSYIENILDFSPFPTVGMALLKEKRLKGLLYCSKQAIEFVSFIAEANCVPLDRIVFIEDPHHTLYVNDKFDLIILPLVDTLGKSFSNSFDLFASLSFTIHYFFVFIE